MYMIDYIAVSSLFIIYLQLCKYFKNSDDSIFDESFEAKMFYINEHIYH